MNKPTIEYHLRFEQLNSHLVDIEAIIPVQVVGNDPTTVRIMLPVWTPGSYLIREYARQIEKIAAFDAVNDIALPIAKVSKNQWDIEVPSGVPQIKVCYQIYCREQSVRTNWIEPEFGFLTGAATFLTVDDEVDRKFRLLIYPVATWPLIACSLSSFESIEPRQQFIQDSEGNSEEVIPLTTCFDRLANSYDELVDSPILMGDLVVREFEVNGCLHYFASYGTSGLWDTDKAVKDVELIIAQQHRFWGEIPYPHFWFMNIAIDSYGGLEHDDCTVLMARKNAMKQRESYVEWLGLVSHEFFHTWNVRRLRPKKLMKYDYHHEQYTPELWIAEGITSYYDDLFLIHSGLISEREYFDLLSKTIRVVEEAPGNTVQSLYDSSYDTWIKHYRPDENSANSRISYYTKGAVVAFLLDQLLREKTNNKLSLDNVMQQLWKTHRFTGYDLADFEKITSDLLGESANDWFQEHVYQARKIDYQPALDRLGLTLEGPSLEEASNVTNSVPTQSSPSVPKTREMDLGLELVLRDGRWLASKVLRGGSAWKVGIQVDDEIIALAGYRMPVTAWRDRINEFRPNQKISTLIARRGKVFELSVSCELKKSFLVEQIPNPTQMQLDNRRRWLGTCSLDLTRFA